MDSLKAVGDAIRRQIARKGYPTVEGFAHEHAIPKGTLSKILNGKVDVKMSTLIRIAKALDMALVDLLSMQGLSESRVMDSPPGIPYQARRKKRKT